MPLLQDEVIEWPLMDVSASFLQLHALPWKACVQNFGMRKEEDMQVPCLTMTDYLMMHMSCVLDRLPIKAMASLIMISHQALFVIIQQQVCIILLLVWLLLFTS